MLYSRSMLVIHFKFSTECCDDWDWNKFKKPDPPMQGDKKLLEGWKEGVA